MSEVAPDGKWSCEWAAQAASSRPPIDTVWNSGGLREVNHPMFRDVSPTDKKQGDQVTYLLGRQIYVNEIWKPIENAEITIEVVRKKVAVENDSFEK